MIKYKLEDLVKELARLNSNDKNNFATEINGPMYSEYVDYCFTDDSCDQQYYSLWVDNKICEIKEHRAKLKEILK